MAVAWGLVSLGAAALGFALLVGGREERIFGAARAAALVSGALVPVLSAGATFIRDTAIALALLAVVLPMALRSAKVWPLAAASIWLAGLMTAAAQTLVHAAPEAYGILQGGWGLLADLVLAAGAWNAWRARIRPD